VGQWARKIDKYGIFENKTSSFGVYNGLLHLYIVITDVDTWNNLSQ